MDRRISVAYAFLFKILLVCLDAVDPHFAAQEHSAMFSGWRVIHGIVPNPASSAHAFNLGKICPTRTRRLSYFLFIPSAAGRRCVAQTPGPKRKSRGTKIPRFRSHAYPFSCYGERGTLLAMPQRHGATGDGACGSVVKNRRRSRRRGVREWPSPRNNFPAAETRDRASNQSSPLAANITRSPGLVGPSTSSSWPSYAKHALMGRTNSPDTVAMCKLAEMPGRNASRSRSRGFTIRTRLWTISGKAMSPHAVAEMIRARAEMIKSSNQAFRASRSRQDEDCKINANDADPCGAEFSCGTRPITRLK